MKVEFEWDEGNAIKSYTKHGVSNQETESAFQDPLRLDFRDPTHSKGEHRFISLARSSRPRVLFIAWTRRGNKVRVISARPASRKERSVYEKAKERR